MLQVRERAPAPNGKEKIAARKLGDKLLFELRTKQRAKRGRESVSAIVPARANHAGDTDSRPPCQSLLMDVAELVKVPGETAGAEARQTLHVYCRTQTMVTWLVFGQPHKVMQVIEGVGGLRAAATNTP